jgi:hypothetical protein
MTFEYSAGTTYSTEDFDSPKKKQTNADRIRNMTDEEMADWLIMNGDGSDYETWLAWLKQEATNAG